MEALAISSIQPKGSLRPPPRTASILSECIRLLLGSVLLFSGLAKMRAPYEFLADVYSYQLTGPFLSLLIAAALPWLEVLVAICLWTKILFRGAMIVAAVLLAVFSTVLAIAVYRQLDISCGCFMAQDKISYLSLIRSVCLFIAAIVGSILAIQSPGTRVSR
jgi:uncharacterized membrane protein YphA (DoxX/SURF4 family)